MKQPGYIIAVILFLLPSNTFSQVHEDESSTKGWANGHYWEVIDKDAKIQHLYGVEAGLNLFAKELSGRVKTDSDWNRIENLRKELTVTGFRFGDVAQQLDKFFEDRSNIRIPVAYAYLYSVKKMSGETPETLERYLASLRREWNK